MDHKMHYAYVAQKYTWCSQMEMFFASRLVRMFSDTERQCHQWVRSNHLGLIIRPRRHPSRREKRGGFAEVPYSSFFLPLVLFLFFFAGLAEIARGHEEENDAQRWTNQRDANS